MVTVFLSCSSDSSSEPCIPITCLNGGTSTADCGCNCPQGYTGTDCSTLIAPTRIKINKVVVTSFPPANSLGSSWDTFYGNPDIYLELYNGSTPIFLSGGNFYTNANYGTEYEFVFSTPATITNVNSLHQISLYDDDAPLTPDFMASQLFTPYINSLGFQPIITITNSSEFFQVKFYVTYEW